MNDTGAQDQSLIIKAKYQGEGTVVKAKGYDQAPPLGFITTSCKILSVPNHKYLVYQTYTLPQTHLSLCD